MYKEIIFILHCFVLSWCFPDPYVFRLTVCFSADPGWSFQYRSGGPLDTHGSSMARRARSSSLDLFPRLIECEFSQCWKPGTFSGE